MIWLLIAVNVFTAVVVDARATNKYPDNWDKQDHYVKTRVIGLGAFYLVLYAVWLWFLYF
jgi:hypothetical protein